MIAPKKVPADRIDVISDFFHEGRVNSEDPGGKSDCLSPANNSIKYGMPITPLMYPESKPKKIPPNAAKAHIRYAFSVTGASTRETSVVPAIVREFKLHPGTFAVLPWEWIGGKGGTKSEETAKEYQRVTCRLSENK